MKSDFNILDAFRQLDFRNVGSFTLDDMVEGLQRNIGFRDFTQNDVLLFFRKNDTYRKGRINF